ncbi:hypothetical protein V5799_018950 [Amblyomma americanum]|uniref:Uncharacterized protein n=1 Tax=Amblyomma americanum TaxID=6943 RepID=A0AAQ4EY96_AMBAM
MAARRPREEHSADVLRLDRLVVAGRPQRSSSARPPPLGAQEPPQTTPPLHRSTAAAAAPLTRSLGGGKHSAAHTTPRRARGLRARATPDDRHCSTPDDHHCRFPVPRSCCCARSSELTSARRVSSRDIRPSPSWCESVAFHAV